MTEQEYKNRRQGQIMMGKHWESMRDELVQQYKNVSATSLAYINGEMADIYALNYNAFENTASKIKGYSFELVDAATVKALATEDRTFLPYKTVNADKFERWCTKKINAEVLQGILQGESIPKMAKRLRNVTEMNKAASVRNARTMATSAENKGRMDSFEKAEADGIILQKKWIAARDNRTRDWHAALDGQLKDRDEPFINSMGEIMYPGDPSAAPANVYNCRCTLGNKVLGFKKVNRTLENNSESDIIKVDKFRTFQSGDEVNKYFGGEGGILQRKNSVEQQWLKKLTADEEAAISSYCAAGYYDVNVYFRGVSGSEFVDADAMKAFAKNLDSAIDKFNLTGNITVYRGVNNNALKDLDLTNLVGSIYEDKGYMSTSPIHASIVDRQEALLEIQVPSGIGKGAYVNSLSGFKDEEYEFLLKRGTKCEVTSVDISGDKPIIKMRVIE